MTKIIEYIGIGVITILIFLILFFSSDQFIEKQLLPKVYFFLIFSYLLGGVIVIKGCKYIENDIFTVLFSFSLFYIFARSLFIVDYYLPSLCLIGFVFAYLGFKCLFKYVEILNLIFLILCVLQATYGLFQYFKIINSSSIYTIVGSYDNPAGFAACLSIVFPILFYFIKRSSPYRIFALISAFIIVIAVILSESRSGIFCIIVVSSIHIYNNLPDYRKKIKIYIIPIISIFIITVFLLLLYLKINSALGRLLIWDVASQMVQNKPIFGSGCGSFLTNYMEYQASYFPKYADNNYALLADNIVHPFNEYLLLIVEYGFLGGAMFIICAISFFRHNKLSSPYVLCLISVALFALFSYPLKYPFVWLIIAFCLAQANNKKRCIYYFKPTVAIGIKALISAVLTGSSFLIFKDIKFEYEWNKITTISLLDHKKEVLGQYESLYKLWNGNYLFLYNYGAVLNNTMEYKKSLEIINKCLQYRNDYYVQMLLATNYYHLKKWSNAEKHYLKANCMCPNKFSPLYRLQQLYTIIGKDKEALQLAYILISKETKIPSINIHYIKNEMQEYIDDHK